MVRQGFKQDARRRVTEALSAQRKERLEQERRHANLAVEIPAAIAERNQAIQVAEQQAADAVRALLADHLSVAEIADLCGGQVDVKELTRLSRIPAVPAAASGGDVVNGWRGKWAAAQITGVIFSSLVWIVVWGLSLPALLVTLAVGVGLVIGRNTRPMLWWRFGAGPANDFQRDTMLTAVVPIPSLRGRRQPAIWIGRRLYGGHVAMPSSSVLVVSPEFVRQIANGQLTDRQASAIISQALGNLEVADSTRVNVVEAYCLPWRFVQILIGAVSQVAGHHATLRFSWKIRWIVFGIAIIDSYLNARWPAFVGVIIITVLSWTTGHFQRRWERTSQNLGDQRTIAEGLGPDLADLIRRGDGSLVTSERADRLRRGALGKTTVARDPAAGSTSPPGTAERTERRGRAGRRES